MSSTSDFVIIEGVLKKYVGPGGDVVIPEGVTSVGLKAFRCCDFFSPVSRQLRALSTLPPAAMPRDMQKKITSPV